MFLQSKDVEIWTASKDEASHNLKEVLLQEKMIRSNVAGPTQ
jgi:hypothetical protein